MDDQTIIELIRTNRHDKAFLALYRNYPAVKKLILSKGGSSQDAEDIYQEALIILCRKVTDPSFTLTAKLSTYLYSVCRFLWKDELKKKQKRHHSDLDENLDTEDDGLQEAVERESKLKAAEKVIMQIGERCRELLQFFYFEKMSMKEIASRMGLSSENVAKNQKYKCIERAKEKLKELKAEAV
jgi:RNA polymerase sigma factor (sigma-70 family)